MRKESPEVLRRQRAIYRDRMAGMTDREIMAKYELVQLHRVGSIFGAQRQRLESYLQLRKIQGHRFMVKYSPISKRAKKLCYSIGCKDFREPNGKGLEESLDFIRWGGQSTATEIREYVHKIKPWDH